MSFSIWWGLATPEWLEASHNYYYGHITYTPENVSVQDLLENINKKSLMEVYLPKLLSELVR
jgi:hypothetical protein